MAENLGEIIIYQYTKFGEFVRILRVKNHQVMGDMAKLLGTFFIGKYPISFSGESSEICLAFLANLAAESS